MLVMLQGLWFSGTGDVSRYVNVNDFGGFSVSADRMALSIPYAVRGLFSPGELSTLGSRVVGSCLRVTITGTTAVSSEAKLFGRDNSVRSILIL